MKQKLWAFLLATVFSYSSFGQILIGTGTTVSQSIPVEPYYGYTYSQVIYTAAEIGASGNITGVKYFAAPGTSISNSNDWTVYIGHTTKSNFANALDWEPLTNLTQVFTGTATLTGNEVTITFSAPFAYNGTDNLIIAVDENAANYNTSSDDFYTSSVTGDRALTFYSDGTNPDPASPSNGNLRSYIANIELQGIAQACSTPNTLTATNITATTADLGWNANGSTAWNIEYGVAPFTATGNPTMSGVTNSQNVTGLTANTTYEFYVQADCGGSGTSSWAGPFSFATACATFTAPYLESFTTNSLPNCWTESGDNPWEYGSSNGTTPAGFAAYGAANLADHTAGGSGTFIGMDGSDNDAGEVSILTSPYIDASSLTVPELNYYVFSNNVDDIAQNELLVEVWDGAAWNTVNTVQANLGNNWVEYSTLLNGLTITGDVQIRFTVTGSATGSTYYNDILIDDVAVREAPTCNNPSSLMASNVLDVSADISWTPGNSENDWNIQIMPSGDPLGSGTISAVNGTPTNSFSGLNDNTPYDVYVQANCGGTDTSDWVGPLTFTTACSAISAPTCEDFETGINCWNNSINDDFDWSVNSGGTPSTATGPTAANGGSNYMYTEASPQANSDSAMILSPFYDLAALTVPMLDFHYHMYGSGMNPDGFIKVEISDDNGVTWNSIFDQTGNQGNQWNQAQVTLGAYTGSTVQFRITGKISSSGTAYENDFAIDDFCLAEAPTCPNPSALMSANILDVSADISWTPGNSENDWNIQIMPSGDPLGSGTISAVNGTPTNSFSGLNDNTPYDVYVQANCGGSDTSDWVGPLTFTTLISSDLSLDAILAPNTGCGLTATEGIELTVTNNGGITTSNFQVCYILNGGTSVCETVNVALPGGQSLTFTLANTVDLSAPGTYDFDFYVDLVGDSITTNDSIIGYSVTSSPTVSGLPYSEDFEASNGGWYTSGTNSSWAHGAPAATIINSTASCNGGNNAWVTNLTGLYNNSELSYLESPCFDMSAVTADPYLIFDLNYDTENGWDNTFVEISVDGGNTWSVLGTVGSGVNWYNSANYWEGNSNGWVSASHLLTGANSNANVKVRFALSTDGSAAYEGVAIDNINIVSSFSDAAATSFDGPNSGCGLTNAEALIATFSNNGADTLTSLDVCYTIDGGAPVCETVSASIMPGTSVQHVFTNTVDLSAAGTYDIVIYPNTTNDISNCNDTIMASVTNQPVISSYPYYESFETGNGGWIEDNSNLGTWALGTPAKSTIIGAASGLNAWTTGGLASGNYNNDEISNVSSPCFDFTTVDTTYWIAAKVWYDSEEEYDGAFLSVSIDNGATWNKVGTSGDDNWYNTGINYTIVDGWDDASNGWVSVKYPVLNAWAGQANVKFRFEFQSDDSVNGYDGFAFDNFVVGQAPTIDLGPDYVGCGSYELTPTEVGTFEWSTEEILTGNVYPLGTGASATFPNTGSVDTTYNAIVVYTDTFGLSASDTIQLTLNPAPYNVLNDLALCGGDTATFMVATGANYAYDWNNGSITETAMYTAAGPVSVTVLDSNTMCSHTATANVVNGTSVDLPATLSSCATDVVIDAGAGFDIYNWSTFATSQTITAIANGTFSVTATDPYGCVSTDSTVVTINALPSVTIMGGMDTICVNHDLMLDAGAGFSTYTWSTSGTSQNETVLGSSLTVSSNNIISVSIVDANGCAATDSISVYVDPCTGINDVEDVMIKVYPNPSNGTLFIDLSNVSVNARINVIDNLGKVVKSINSNGSELLEMNISSLERGLYFINITTTNTSKTVRIIKN